MAFLGFFNIYALRANLSIAILDMVKDSTYTDRNGTLHTVRGEFRHWSSFTTGLILSSFFYGYILTQIPGGWLAARQGGVRVFGLGVLATALLTLLTPPLAHLGAPVLITVRVCEGLAEGVTYPAIHAVWRHWAPPLEKTKLATFAFAGSYFGNAVSMPVSAWLATNFGWPTIFYFFGLVALAWCVLWWKTVSETPAEDKHMSAEELAHITRCIGYTPQQIQKAVCRTNRRLVHEPEASKQQQELKLPWAEIIKSKAVWAITAAHFAENWGFYTMLTYLPTFVSSQMGYEMEKTGLVSAIPYAVMGTVVIGGGQLGDYLREKRHVETGLVRRLFVCLAFGTQAVFLLLMAHSSIPALAVALVTVAVGVGGLAWAGFAVNHLDIAPQFASVLMGVSNSVATLPGIIAPSVVGAIVTDTSDVWEWRLVFYIVAGIYISGGAAFYFLASGQVQPWAEIPGGYVSELAELDPRLEPESAAKREQ